MSDGNVVQLPAAMPDQRVMRSHLVEFRTPGTCGHPDNLRRAAAWLDEHIEPALLAVRCDYDDDPDESVLTLVVQAFDDEDLERMIGQGRP